MGKELDLFASTPLAMEDMLAGELRDMGAGQIAPTQAGVAFRGDLRTAYRACLWSRLASRVLLRIGSFPARNDDELYDGVRSIRWFQHLRPEGTLAVDFHSNSRDFAHTRYGAQRVKDAVVDQFRDEFAVRPSVDLRRPDVRINTLVRRGEVILSLDLAGDGLFRRGYRKEGAQVEAPLKENLAAAVLLRAGWPGVAAGGGALIDPMCGSGTLLVEGALMAGGMAPGLGREYYGFQGWLGHEEAVWEELREDAAQRKRTALEGLPIIAGYDADPEAVKIASENVKRAGLDGVVKVLRRDLSDLQAGRAGRGLVVVNPPYGERQGCRKELAGLYGLLGRRLKEGFRGWKASVYTAAPELGKNMGLRSHRQYTLYNGSLKGRVLNFEVEPRWFVA